MCYVTRNEKPNLKKIPVYPPLINLIKIKPPKAMSGRNHILNLYKTLLRESQKFASYNFRCYAVRRVRDAFRQNQHVNDPEGVKSLVEEAHKNLEIVKRQTSISQMYRTDKLVIEHRK
ncbi:LYR motif-containing protein 4 [Euwallacea fornicatus]|uniref:LYR motif-containing protein 4 n=1 Tax=Euwallacea fornicatus TaxID=995702 RepID=UPI00338EB668